VTEIITSTEHGIEEGERRAERDLGAIANEVEHLAASLAEHTTTIQGLREDREWITRRFEQIERDLIAIPRVPEELASTVSESLAHLTNRVERLETPLEEERTRAPQRERESDEDRSRESDERKEKSRSTLDHLF
jgi:DNA repair exonuclease SbcCD ATPase subunit